MRYLDRYMQVFIEEKLDNFKNNRYKNDTYNVYWQGRKMLKTRSFSGWASFIKKIFESNSSMRFETFVYDMRERYNRYASLLNIGNGYSYNNGPKISVHYDKSVIKDIMKPDRIEIEWYEFSQVIYLNKEYAAYRDISGNRRILEHSLDKVDRSFAFMLQYNCEFLPDNYKSDKNVNFEDLVNLIEMVNY